MAFAATPAADNDESTQASIAQGTTLRVIRHTCAARVGLLGNPSDGYNGQTISFLVDKFSAEVVLREKSDKRIVIQPHPLHDTIEHSNLDELHSNIAKHGAYGGHRLMLCAVQTYLDEMSARQAFPSEDANGFCLSYDTNIPRQAGLSGSSALITACFRCLMEYYQTKGLIDLVELPSIILSVESRLGITAGLQDRVIQCYGGLVHMDFDAAHMKEKSYGIYTRMPLQLLDDCFLILAIADDPSDSGKIHATVRERYNAGDADTISILQRLASLAAQGKSVIENRDWDSLGKLMDKNFDLRRELFGDSALGTKNLQMIRFLRDNGAYAKFSGSGGAAVALIPGGEQQFHDLLSKAPDQGLTLHRIKAIL